MSRVLNRIECTLHELALAVLDIARAVRELRARPTLHITVNVAVLNVLNDPVNYRLIQVVDEESGGLTN